MSRGEIKTLPGYLSPGQVMKRIGVNRNMLATFVRSGVLTPNDFSEQGIKTALFAEQEVEDVRAELLLAMLKRTSAHVPPMYFRTVKKEDAYGVVSVLTSHGWPTTTAGQRLEWYEKNPEIDHVVVQPFNGQEVIAGYINAVPYTQEALEKMMRAEWRGWNIKQEHILAFEPGKTYDLFIGLAARADILNVAECGRMLITHFAHDVLPDLAARGIVIEHLYAHTDEEAGYKWLRALGFVEQDKPGKFARYELNLRTIDNPLAHAYQAALKRT